MVSSFILDGRNVNSLVNKDDIWSVTKMKNYFALIRYIKPKVTPQCERILQAYYKQQRSASHRNAARTTPRLLQSLLRLAEGHARLMFRDEVLIIDAVMAIILMESSMLGFSVFKELSPLHTNFPTDPDAEYEDRAKTVLGLLKLEELLPEIRNFENCYTEFSIKKSLLEISSVWDSKEEANQCDSFQAEKSESHQDVSEPYKLQENISALNSVGLNCDAKQENRLDKSDSTQIVLNPQDASETVNQFINTLVSSNSETAKNVPYSVMSQHNVNNVNHFNEISTVSDLNKIFCENTFDICRDILKPSTINHAEKTLNEALNNELFDFNKTLNNKESIVNDFTLQTDSNIKISTSDISHSSPPIITSPKSPVAKKLKLESHPSTSTNRFKKFIFMRKKQTFEADNNFLADASNNQTENCLEQKLQHNDETVKDSVSVKELCMNENLHDNKGDQNVYSGHDSTNLQLESANSSHNGNTRHKSFQKGVQTTSKNSLCISRERIWEKMKKFKFEEKSANLNEAVETVVVKPSSKDSNAVATETEKAGTSTDLQNNTKIKESVVPKTQSSQAIFKKIFGSSVRKFDISDFDF